MHETNSLNSQIVEIDCSNISAPTTDTPDVPYTPARIAQLRKQQELIRDYGTPEDRAHAASALRRLAEIEAAQKSNPRQEPKD